MISAGIEAHGVNPNAIKVMNEVGVDISTQTSVIINTGLRVKDLVRLKVHDVKNKTFFNKHVERLHIFRS